MRRIAALSLALAGCVAPADPDALPRYDVDFYQAHVDPVVAWSCASLECHGVDGRPLRLYAEDGLRASDGLRGHPLTRAEAGENALAFAAVDPEPATVDEHIALTKPLAVEAGGIEHAGDPLWPSREDPSYVCLRGWLAGDPSAAAACDEAARRVVPPP